MWPFLQNLARTGGTRAAGLLDDFMRQQVVTGARRVGPQVRKQAEQGGLTGLVGDIRQATATPVFRRSSQAVAGAAGIDTANQLGLTGQIERGLNQIGPGIDRFFGAITPQPIQQFGREMEKAGWGALGGVVPGEISQTPTSSFSGRPEGSMATLGGRPVQWMNNKWVPFMTEGEMARQQQQKPDVPAAPALPAPSFSSSSPEQRAERQERSRVAQMTEQDPLFKKYQVADLTKAYNTATTPEEKERIGLQIWATTNPSLASRLRPGQTGYQTSAAMSGSQVFGKDIPGITQTFYQQASEQVGVPFPGAAQGASMNAFGLGANAQQLGVSAPGQIPPTMIGEDVFKRGIKPPSSEDLTQTQLALLKRAFEGRLK